MQYSTGLILVLGSFHHLDSLPLESDINPVVYSKSDSNPVVHSGTRTSTPPLGEKILPVMSCENASTPHSLRPTSTEPHCGRGTGQASIIREVSSQVWSENSSGTSQALSASLPVPSRQESSAPDIPMPSEISRLQTESHVHARDEGIDLTTDEALLKEAIPQKGPVRGGIQILLLGENFPSGPVYVRFGDNWARAVSDAQYHYPF